MSPIIRNILAVVVGFIVGSMVNIGLVNLGPMIVPLPGGADVSTMEALKESMQTFKPINFLFPFLAHALGTLVGAFVAAKLAVSHHVKLALFIGGFFFIGGVMMVNMIGGPLWFIVADLVLAYIPMAFLGGKLASKSD